tara:strand:- start:339 stop:794 length:456 start_codon:yes stop_codon:yes gene_type:complete
MDIKKKLSSRENEILVEAVIERLEPVLKAGNKVTTNFTNRVVALDKQVQQTNMNQINLQLDSQKHNKENLNQFLAHFSIAFSEIETKVIQVDEKSQANFEILEEVKEIIPLVKQIHKWTFSISNFLNAELNYPAPKDQEEYLQDPEEEIYD